jgi:hypothetical protein
MIFIIDINFILIRWFIDTVYRRALSSLAHSARMYACKQSRHAHRHFRLIDISQYQWLNAIELSSRQAGPHRRPGFSISISYHISLVDVDTLYMTPTIAWASLICIDWVKPFANDIIKTTVYLYGVLESTFEHLYAHNFDAYASLLKSPNRWTHESLFWYVSMYWYDYATINCIVSSA